MARVASAQYAMPVATEAATASSREPGPNWAITTQWTR